MGLKLTQTNSNIDVDTFVIASETTDIEVNHDKCIVKANVMFDFQANDFLNKNNISKESATPEQLRLLLEHVAELKENKSQPTKEKVMSWLNETAIFSTIAQSDSTVALVSAVIALGLNQINDMLKR